MAGEVRSQQMGENVSDGKYCYVTVLDFYYYLCLVCLSLSFLYTAVCLSVRVVSWQVNQV